MSVPNTQQPGLSVQTQVDFINPRAGNKPASIKGSDGNYYTISDAASMQYQNHVNMNPITITYYEKPGRNGHTFRNVTHVNGEPMPKDAYSGNGNGNGSATVHAIPVQSSPRPVAQSAQPARPEDVPPGICGILKSAIESGVSREEATEWIRLGLRKPPKNIAPAAGDDVGLDDEIPF